MKPLIVNLAPTGMIPTRDMTPHVPLTPVEIASEVDGCAALGVSMVHLHARDELGAPTYRKAIYAETLGRIRERHPELVLVVSTSGRTHGEYAQRSEVLELEGDLRPDLASLTLGSMNFSRSASVNSPDMIQRLAARMQERGIRPELEVFDLGMVNVAHYLILKGLITPPYYFNILLGNVATAQAKLTHLGLLVSELPADSIWSLGGIGDSQSTLTALGTVVADGVRVGLEDNLFTDESRATLSTNQAQVTRMAQLAQAQGRTLETPDRLRQRLGLLG